VDEELRQAIESVKEQQPVQVNLDWYQDTIKLPEIKEFIRANINSASRSFVAIGYYLKYVRDNQLYKEDGYDNIWEFAKSEFGIGKSSASQFMSINDKFSKDGNSPILLEQYKDFTSSKLAEMLTMSNEQLEQVTPATTIVEIRQIKKPEQEETVLTSEQEPESINLPTIDDLDFSVNTYNCLKRANIDTIEQLCNLTVNKVIAIRNISRKCLDEIKEKLTDIGRELKPDDIPETVNDEPEIVDNETEIVNDVDETVLLPCDTCGWDVKECCDYDNEDMHCVCGDAWKPKESEPVETVEADIIQTVLEDKATSKQKPDKWYYMVPIGANDITGKEIREGDLLEWTGLTGNTKLYQVYYEARELSFIACQVDRIGTNDLRLIQTHELCKSRIVCNAHESEEFIPEEVIQEPEPVQPELPIFKNNDQRKEWAENYMAWGEWYYDEHIDCHYYKYDFPNGDRLIVDEYRDREYYWSDKKKDEQHYHLLRMKKPAYGGTKTFEQKYMHQTSSMTEIVDYLKDLQKKGA
jgi:hypothetical protein